MLFYLVIIYLTLYYVRPSEWVQSVYGIPLLMIAGVISLLYLGVGAISKKFPNMLDGQAERMMFGYATAIILSQLSHMYIGGAVNAINLFIPAITGFLLVICFVDSSKRIHLFILLLIILTTFLAYEGWMQHSTGLSHGGLEPVFENKRTSDEELIKIPRIRWYGVFNDPNDLGLALVLVVPFLLNMLLHRRIILPVVTLPLLSIAIYYTNSRGTVLAGLVAIGSYFIVRFRSIYGALVGAAFTLILFLFGPSRMSSVSASGESAYGRIEAWYEAYQMFKANPLFGVGQGMFKNYHILTAHNSFVLVMAELGFVGLFFFTGLFYYPYNWLWNNVLKKESIPLDTEDIGLVSATFSSLTGMIASMFFLSRSYILLPFMLVALATGVTRVFEPKVHESNFSAIKTKHIRNIFLITLFQIIGINIFVKLFI